MKFSICILFVLAVTTRKCENSSSGSRTQEQTIAISSDCKRSVEIFNESPTQRIIRDIQFINKKLGRIPNELVDTYPDARDKWNSGLREIKSSFSKNFVVGMATSPGAGKVGWQNAGLANYELFFHWLTYYRNRDISEVPATDMEGIPGWIESSNINERLNIPMKSLLKEDNCMHTESSAIKATLKPKELPETIQECLN